VTLTDFPLADAEDMSDKDGAKGRSPCVATWQRMRIVSTRFELSFVRLRFSVISCCRYYNKSLALPASYKVRKQCIKTADGLARIIAWSASKQKLAKRWQREKNEMLEKLSANMVLYSCMHEQTAPQS
jgi:hypothetical protein